MTHPVPDWRIREQRTPHRFAGSRTLVKGSERVLRLEARIKTRKGEPWWHLARSDHPTSRTEPVVDDFTEALVPVWQIQGDGEVKGLQNSAAGTPKQGIVTLLGTLDDAIWSLRERSCDAK